MASPTASHPYSSAVHMGGYTRATPEEVSRRADVLEDLYQHPPFVAVVNQLGLNLERLTITPYIQGKSCLISLSDGQIRKRIPIESFDPKTQETIAYLLGRGRRPDFSAAEEAETSPTPDHAGASSAPAHSPTSVEASTHPTHPGFGTHPTHPGYSVPATHPGLMPQRTESAVQVVPQNYQQWESLVSKFCSTVEETNREHRRTVESMMETMRRTQEEHTRQIQYLVGVISNMASERTSGRSYTYPPQIHIPRDRRPPQPEAFDESPLGSAHFSPGSEDSEEELRSPRTTDRTSHRHVHTSRRRRERVPSHDPFTTSVGRSLPPADREHTLDTPSPYAPAPMWTRRTSSREEAAPHSSLPGVFTPSFESSSSPHALAPMHPFTSSRDHEERRPSESPFSLTSSTESTRYRSYDAPASSLSSTARPLTLDRHSVSRLSPHPPDTRTPLRAQHRRTRSLSLRRRSTRRDQTDRKHETPPVVFPQFSLHESSRFAAKPKPASDRSPPSAAAPGEAQKKKDYTGAWRLLPGFLRRS